MSACPPGRRLRWQPLRTLAQALLLTLLAGCAPLSTQRPPATAQDRQHRQDPPGKAPRLRLIGSAALPHDTRHGGTMVGGLSGIDYDAARDAYLLISDDRSRHDPARIYTARLRYSATALAAPELTGVRTLLHASGQPYAPWHAPRSGMDVPDPEAVRWLPGGAQFVWTSEGDFGRGFGPQLHVSGADGAALRSIALPASFMPAPGLLHGLLPGHGPRGNGTLEGLALTPDGRTAWLAMELPWRQDGAPATPASGGAPVRITAIDLASGRPLRQIAYQPDAVPQARRLPWGPQINGVSEILADGAHHLLVLERAYSAGAGFAARLYRIDTRDGSDTLALHALAPANHRRAPKTLVADFADFAAQGLAVDNLEGMTWGPPLPGGGCVLVFVSDDNFNPAQVTQFIAAEYLAPASGHDLPPAGGHGPCGTTGASPTGPSP